MQEMQVILRQLPQTLEIDPVAEGIVLCWSAAVAYTCRQQHPDSRHESQTASDDDHHPAVLPRVLLLGHPKVPIGLATALAQLPLGIKAAVTMPAHLMQLSSGADGEHSVLW
jgi:hypothetical protein